MPKILLTGASGFVGGHILLAALEAGHDVRATVRSAAREDVVRELLERAGATRADAVSFAHADLTDDAGWADAADGCTHVLHTASPFPGAEPEHEDELIVPAREGTLRVLRAAHAAGAQRVVVTSSFAAVGYGIKPANGEAYTEVDWTDVEATGVGAYIKSKTIAERAAWNYVAEHDDAPELATVNPPFIIGPATGTTDSTSLAFIEKVLRGTVDPIPRRFGLVDVRDVADLHLRALTDARAAGRRFLAAAYDDLTIADIALAIKDAAGDDAVPVTREELEQMLPDVPHLRISHDRARTELGWAPRPLREALADTVASLAAAQR
jgi:nucleoside-diphosphate-sugar epimerase